MKKIPSQKQVLFSKQMVQAILAGEKTQMRRVVKPQRASDIEIDLMSERGYAAWSEKCPYQPGDVIWVKETWTLMEPKEEEGPPFCLYKADEPDCESSPWFSGWRTAHSMPQFISRIPLRVVDIRIELLQQIKLKEIWSEGVANIFYFKKLWDKHRAKRGLGWDENPWVWVIEFERIVPLECESEGEGEEL